MMNFTLEKFKNIDKKKFRALPWACFAIIIEYVWSLGQNIPFKAAFFLSAKF